MTEGCGSYIRSIFKGVSRVDVYCGDLVIDEVKGTSKKEFCKVCDSDDYQTRKSGVATQKVEDLIIDKKPKEDVDRIINKISGIIQTIYSIGYEEGKSGGIESAPKIKEDKIIKIGIYLVIIILLIYLAICFNMRFL